MDKKKDRMENLSDFKGNIMPSRSAKPEFKPVIVVKNNMDDDTRLERQYLGPELSEILQTSKAQEEKNAKQQ